MKKSMLLMAFAATFTLCQASCTQKDKSAPQEESSSTTTAVSADTPSPEATDQAAPVLTAKGIGVIEKGKKASALPASVSGLYDKKKLETFENEMDGYVERTLIFYLGNVEVIKARVSDDGIIESVGIFSKKFKASSGLAPGMPVKSLSRKDITWTFYFDTGVYAEDANFYYNVSPEHITESGSLHAENNISDFGKASDFTPNATIESIYTKFE